MTLSFKRTIDLFLIAMAALAITVAILTVSAAEQRAIMTSAQSSLSSLHLKIQDLRLLQSKASAAHEPVSIDAAVTAFGALQTISGTLDNLEFNNSSPLASGAISTGDLLESYRVDYLALLSSYNERSKHKKINEGLFALIEQRLALLPDAHAAALRPSLESFRAQVTLFGQDGNENRLDRLQAMKQSITALTADSSLLMSIDTIIAECRHHLADKKTLLPLEQTVGKKSYAFAKQAETRIEELSSLIDDQLRRRQRITYGIIGAMIAALACACRFIRTRHIEFIDNARQAEQAIRTVCSENFPDADPGDDLNHRVAFLKKMAVCLSRTRTDLHDHRQRLQTLFDVTGEWVLTCDAEQMCTGSNRRAKEITGYDPVELIGKPLSTILEGNPTAALTPVLSAALAGRTPFERLAYEVQHVNGSLIPVAISGHPLVTIADEYAGFTLAIYDLSNERRAEQQLKEASLTADFLHKVLELALLNLDLPELMDRFLGHLIDRSWFATQPRAAFFLIDKHTNSLTMTAQRGIDTHVIDSCSVLPIGTCLCGRAALSGKIVFADCRDPRHEMSYPGMAVHGHYCLPIHTVAGEIIGVVVLYLDPDYQRDNAIEAILANAATMVGSIIRRRQVEDTLKAVNLDLEHRIEVRTAQLSAANEELAAFAYSVSHDLRAPLRAIGGFSEALTEECGQDLSPQGRDYLARIKAGCRKMESLIADILDLSRLTRQELQRQHVDLSRMAQEISEEVRAESPHRMVEWKIAPNVEAMADPTMIRAALTNLLANAWKYSQYKETATIEFDRFHSDTGETVYCVRDNGAGFDMQYAEKLFKPFQRLHSQEQFAGNGIGLATVQRIVHRHGGRIWAEGEEEVGATVYFTLSPPGRGQNQAPDHTGTRLGLPSK